MENASQTPSPVHFVPNCGPEEIFPEEAKRLTEMEQDAKAGEDLRVEAIREFSSLVLRADEMSVEEFENQLMQIGRLVKPF